MKNNLNNEEKFLREKLNQAESDFNYQESNWQEMQQLIQKKGFIAQYASIFKAAIGFAVLISGVYLINTNWDNNSTISNPVEQSLNTTEAIQSNEANEMIAPNESIAETTSEQAVEEEPVANTQAKNTDIETDNKPKPTVSKQELATNANMDKGSNEKPEPKSNETAVTPINNTKKQLDFALIGIELSGSSCVGNIVMLKANTSGESAEKMSYKWTNNQKTLNSKTNKIELKLDEAGKQNISVTAIHNGIIQSTENLTINVGQGVELDFSYLDLESPYTDLTVELTALSEGLSNYRWNIEGAANEMQGEKTSFKFDRKGVFDVELSYISPEGCVSSITKPVAVELNFMPLAPNAFTPDGNDLNETFIPVGFTPEAGIIGDDLFRMSIYDYNAKLVYTTTSNREPWNGRLNNQGNVLPEGAYVWKVELENSKGQQANFAGKVRIRY